MPAAPLAIELLAFESANQQGFVTRAQALQAGVDDFTLGRLSRRGILTRLDHGVYRFAGATALAHQDLYAAWLRLAPERHAVERTLDDPDSWVSHDSAAHLWGLGDLPADVHHFIVGDRHQTRRANVRLHRRPGGLSSHEWTLHEGMPVVRLPRLIADLVAATYDGGHIGAIARDALERQLTSRTELAAAVDTVARQRQLDGDTLVTHLLASAAGSSAA